MWRVTAGWSARGGHRVAHCFRDRDQSPSTTSASTPDVRVVLALFTDGGLRAVAGNHHGFVGQGKQLVADRAQDLLQEPPGKSVRPMPPSNRVSPASRSGALAGRFDEQSYGTGRVSGRV
jgi:hypothetical protein